MKKVNLLLVLLGLAVMCPAQQLNAGWEKQLSQMLEEFKACAPDAENGQNRCQQFTAQCFSTVYNVKDFYASADKRYMNLPEMVAYLQQSGKWTALGAGYDPKVLANAQTYANEGKAVVAVYMSEEQLGHASIILPGELKLSGTWGVKVPNSASFFTYNPTNSYLHKSLAYAYERANLGKVQLYVKNY